jgi:hypothetical protein
VRRTSRERRPCGRSDVPDAESERHDEHGIVLVADEVMTVIADRHAQN